VEPVREEGLVDGDVVLAEAYKVEKEVKQMATGFDDEIEDEGSVLSLDGVEGMLVLGEARVESWCKHVIRGALDA
jgi:hypothetical protein